MSTGAGHLFNCRASAFLAEKSIISKRCLSRLDVGHLLFTCIAGNAAMAVRKSYLQGCSAAARLVEWRQKFAFYSRAGGAKLAEAVPPTQPRKHIKSNLHDPTCFTSDSRNCRSHVHLLSQTSVPERPLSDMRLQSALSVLASPRRNGTMSMWRREHASFVLYLIS